MNNAPEEDHYSKKLFKLPSVADLFYPELELENPINIQYAVREKTRIMPKYIEAYESLLQLPTDDIDAFLKEAESTLKWIAEGLKVHWGDMLVRSYYSDNGRLPCIYVYTDGRGPSDEGDEEYYYNLAIKRYDGKVGPVPALARLVEHLEEAQYRIDHLAYQAKWYLKYGH